MSFFIILKKYYFNHNLSTRFISISKISQKKRRETQKNRRLDKIEKKLSSYNLNKQRKRISKSIRNKLKFMLLILFFNVIQTLINVVFMLLYICLEDRVARQKEHRVKMNNHKIALLMDLI